MREVLVPFTTIVVVVWSRSGRCGSMIIRFEWAGAASHWVEGSEAHFPAPTTHRHFESRLGSEVTADQARDPANGLVAAWRRLGNSVLTLGFGPRLC
jgi:hypothetical protein